MFVDARRLTAGSADPPLIRGRVGIVGGGVAGITLALLLGRAGVDVVLLESGGRRAEEATDRLARGETYDDPVGPAYQLDEHSQGRLLGGSSNLWGGWCRPLEADDVAARPWVPGSGWPIGYDEIAAYYGRAGEILDLGPDRWDTAYWAAAVARPDVHTVSLDGGVETSFSQFSGRHRIGTRYADELGRLPSVTVVEHATAVGVEHADGRVDRVRACTPEGRPLLLAAETVVLAAGGIENPRLLLAAGLGGDQVGHYFADHARMLIGRVERCGPLLDNRLYDIRTQDREPGIRAHGVAVAANWVLSPEVRERERLLSGRVWLRSRLVADERPGVLGVRAARTDVTLRGRPQRRHVLAAARGVASIAAYAVGRAVPGLRRRTAFEVIGEQPPTAASTITLGSTRDPLGVPVARVGWRLDDEVGRSSHRTVELVADALRRAGAAESVVPPLPADWRAHVIGTWHPMGATRMSASSATGVVDTDCRVHGLANLYVAGSSTFPTTGANFPTLTLTALAVRLADHLEGRS